MLPISPTTSIKQEYIQYCIEISWIEQLRRMIELLQKEFNTLHLYVEPGLDLHSLMHRIRKLPEVSSVMQPNKYLPIISILLKTKHPPVLPEEHKFIPINQGVINES